MRSLENWNLKIEAAYWRILGYTQAEAGAKVHRTGRTIFTWENDPSWEDARNEAKKRYMQDLLNECRKAVKDQIKDGDGNLALKVLERAEEAFAPPQQKVQIDSNSTADILILGGNKQQYLDALKTMAEDTQNGHHSPA